MYPSKSGMSKCECPRLTLRLMEATIPRSQGRYGTICGFLPVNQSARQWGRCWPSDDRQDKPDVALISAPWERGLRTEVLHAKKSCYLHPCLPKRIFDREITDLGEGCLEPIRPPDPRRNVLGAFAMATLNPLIKT